MSTCPSCVLVGQALSFLAKQNESCGFASSDISHSAGNTAHVTNPASESAGGCAGDMTLCPAGVTRVAPYLGQPLAPAHDGFDDGYQSFVFPSNQQLSNQQASNQQPWNGNEVVVYRPHCQTPVRTFPEKMREAQFEFGVRFADNSMTKQTTTQTCPCLSPPEPVTADIGSEDVSEAAVRAAGSARQQHGARAHGAAGCQKRNVSTCTLHARGAAHKRVLPPCRVCGCAASGFHYGVNTCEACKGFFRRSLKKGSDFRCRGQNNCTVRGDKRNQCAFCRYQRCLALGMSRLAIKTGRYPHEKRTRDTLEVRALSARDAGQPDATEQQMEELLAPILETGYALHQCTRSYPLDSAIMMQTGAQNGCPSHDNTPRLFKLFFETIRHFLWCEETSLSMEYSVELSCLANHYISLAKSLPLFPNLSPADQLTLMTSSWLEVLILGDGLRGNRIADRRSHPRFHFPELSQLTGVEFVGTLCEVLNSLQRLKLTADESILVQALILVSSDRPSLQNRRTADRSQALVARCLLHRLQRSHGNHCGRKFAEIVRHVTNIRAITEESEKLQLPESPPKRLDLAWCPQMEAASDTLTVHAADACCVS